MIDQLARLQHELDCIEMSRPTLGELMDKIAKQPGEFIEITSGWGTVPAIQPEESA